MRLSNVREAACIRASTLLNQANPKKGFKQIQPELQNVIIYKLILFRCQKFSE